MIRFDDTDGQHRYFYVHPDGTETALGGVTSTLKRSGLIDDYWYQPSGSLRGTYVHQACELLDAGNLDVDDLDPQLLPYVKGYQKFVRENQPRYTAIELPVCDLELCYGGTLDRAGTFTAGIHAGREFVADLKSGAKSGFHRYQLAAYARAFYGRAATEVLRCAVRLTKGYGGNYILDPYGDPHDFKVWEAACIIAQAQKQAKLNRREETGSLVD